MANAAIEADETTKMKTSRPLYELRLSAIGTMESQPAPTCCGMLAPIRLLAMGASASMKKPGRMPAIRQIAARRYIADKEYLSISCAVAAAGVRGRPRKLTPKALTK